MTVCGSISLRVPFVLSLVLAAAPAVLRAAEPPADSLAVVQQRLAEGEAVLLDVREKDEWDAGRLAAARLAPLSALGDKNVDPRTLLEGVAPGQVVYCHCKAGGRAEIAAKILCRYGYDARPIRQGYQELLEAGFAPARQ